MYHARVCLLSAPFCVCCSSWCREAMSATEVKHITSAKICVMSSKASRVLCLQGEQELNALISTISKVLSAAAQSGEV